MAFKSKSLTPTILRIVENKGTEHPFTGTYNDWDQAGTYLCRQCGLALFESENKFHSGCGWPSFDEGLNKAVLEERDRDGLRTEILCSRCHAHLGHVFQGEKMTAKNIRHCVNSLSLDFVPVLGVKDTAEAIFGAGCFWGVEYYFKKLPGVLRVEVGYTGGSKDSPTYEDICSGRTGHIEAARVLYDPERLSYQDLAKYFFEIHDPTQTNGQGPDLGEQYLSVVFYYNEKEKGTAEALIEELEAKGLKIATVLRPVSTFWPAENYHQDYYQKTGKQPYCHHYQKRF